MAIACEQTMNYIDCFLCLNNNFVIFYSQFQTGALTFYHIMCFMLHCVFLLYFLSNVFLRIVFSFSQRSPFVCRVFFFLTSMSVFLLHLFHVGTLLSIIINHRGLLFFKKRDGILQCVHRYWTIYLKSYETRQCNIQVIPYPSRLQQKERQVWELNLCPSTSKHWNISPLTTPRPLNYYHFFFFTPPRNRGGVIFLLQFVCVCVCVCLSVC